jgi:hypothetical protein
MGTDQSKINGEEIVPNHQKNQLRELKNNLYQATLKDDLYQFSHFFKALQNLDVDLDHDFVSWILTTAVSKGSINILKYVKYETSLFTKEILLEIIEDEVLNSIDFSSLQQIETLTWLLESENPSKELKQKLTEFLKGSVVKQKRLQNLFKLVKVEEPCLPEGPPEQYRVVTNDAGDSTEDPNELIVYSEI